jgi:hypothetical protein
MHMQKYPLIFVIKVGILWTKHSEDMFFVFITYETDTTLTGIQNVNVWFLCEHML